MTLQPAAVPSFNQPGRMARRLREHDWSVSTLGPRSTWPHSLNLALNICLDSHFPIAIWWGPDLIQFYNDAYQPIIGDDKDVTGFGGPAFESWQEIWDTIGPMVEQVMQQGEAVRGEDLPLWIRRNGVLGLAHFTFSYSPIRDDSGAVLGMFTAAVETTARMDLERRQAFRLKLAQDLRQMPGPDAAMQAASLALGDYLDAPFVRLGAIDAATRSVVLQPATPDGAALTIALDGPRAAWHTALDGGAPVRLDDLRDQAPVPGIASLLMLAASEDGSVGTVLVAGKHAPYRWTDGDVLSARESLDQIEGVLRRLRAEQLVRQNLATEIERLRHMFDQAPSFLAVTQGPQHVFDLANAAFGSLVGEREILGLPVRAALPELGGQGFFELLDEVYATGVPFISRGTPIKLQRTPDAPLDELMVDFIYQPVLDAEGTVTGILIEGTDVSMQYSAQAELVRERDLSQHVLSSMKEGFAIVGSDLTVRQVNDEGVRLAQRPREAIVGMPAGAVWPWLDGDATDALSGRVLASHAAEIRDVPFAWPDGRQAWMELRIYSSLDDSMALFFRDITERKVAQRQLRDADKRKDEFLAMLAHELRNPLAPIGAAADLLRMAQLDEARLRQTSGIITRQVRHMTSLINDLMDVSRVTRGLITLEHDILDAKALIADAVEQTRPLIAARRHSLDVHTPHEPAFVRGDQKRLVQVLANLLGNAAKYTPEGGEIAVSLEVRGALVRFTVRDNGIGMAPSLIASVFELFMQGERTSDRSQGGLGIGLALVHSLVELHGGAVSAHSAGLGQGSEFTVVLPAVASDVDALPAPAHRLPAPTGPRLRIMVVDDNVDAAQMLSMFLEAAGHDVVTEHSPYAALERARVDTVDVFLLDIGLPDMDGYELAQRLRQRAGGAGATFIAITGYGQESDRGSSMNAGFSYHFVKPVDTLELARLLATLAEKPARFKAGSS